MLLKTDKADQLLKEPIIKVKKLNKDNWILLMIYDKCTHEKKKWKNKTGKRSLVLHILLSMYKAIHN